MTALVLFQYKFRVLTSHVSSGNTTATKPNAQLHCYLLKGARWLIRHLLPKTL